MICIVDIDYMQESKNITKKSSLDKLCVYLSFIWSNGVTEIRVGPRKSVRGPQNKARGPGIFTVPGPQIYTFTTADSWDQTIKCTHVSSLNWMLTILKLHDYITYSPISHSPKVSQGTAAKTDFPEVLNTAANSDDVKAT